MILYQICYSIYNLLVESLGCGPLCSSSKKKSITSRRVLESTTRCISLLTVGAPVPKEKEVAVAAAHRHAMDYNTMRNVPRFSIAPDGVTDRHTP